MKQKSNYRLAVLAVTLMGAVLSTLPRAAADHGRHAGPKVCSVCRQTASLARRAAYHEAHDDYYIARGKANNMTDRNDRNDALREASAELREAHALAHKQYQARIAICKELGECRYDPDIDPENFLSPEEIAADPNPLWPLIPGRIFTFEAETDEGLETIVLTITYDTREVAGVECVVVRDTVTVEGELVEDTYDWFTQDRDGNVWYFGELSLSYEDGELDSLEGSWETGKDGAKPGIVMLADPQVGDIYRQEFLFGEAEDMARVIGLNETVTVEAGTFEGCVKTEEFLPIEPDALEHKYFAPGIGFVFEVKPEDGETLELVKMEVFDAPEDDGEEAEDPEDEGEEDDE